MRRKRQFAWICTLQKVYRCWYSTRTGCGCYLPACLFEVCSVSICIEVGKIELNLVPIIVENEWQRANEWLHFRLRLVGGCAESAPGLLCVHYLHLKSEVLLRLQLK